MYATDGQLSIEECQFHNNVAALGGAVAVDPSLSSSITQLCCDCGCGSLFCHDFTKLL